MLKNSLLLLMLLAMPLLSPAQSTIFNFQDDVPAETQPRPEPPPAPAPAPVIPPLPERRPTEPTGGAQRPVPQPGPNQQTEAGVVTECPTCRINKNIADLQALVNGRLRIGDLTSWRKNRGLVQIPTKGNLGNIGPCGTFHYSPDRGRGGELIDNWASPTSACAMMSVFQDWKRRCPSNQSGCRIAWGDISHKTDPGFGGTHRTHTQGHCWDIRPMRRGGFENSGLNYPQSDRKTTADFVRLLKSKGGSPIYYNDPQAGASSMSGHSNHIHVCFHPNKKTKDVCNSFKYDPAICGAE